MVYTAQIAAQRPRIKQNSDRFNDPEPICQTSVMTILKGVPRILSPELLRVLARMGHGGASYRFLNVSAYICMDLSRCCPSQTAWFLQVRSSVPLSLRCLVLCVYTQM